MREENKVPLLAIAILVIFLLLCVACTKTNKTFILDPSITYPEERNVLVAVPVIPVEIGTIKKYTPITQNLFYVKNSLLGRV